MRKLLFPIFIITLMLTGFIVSADEDPPEEPIVYIGTVASVESNDIILGDAVDAGGNLTITGRDCNPEDEDYVWGDVWAQSTLDAGGNIDFRLYGLAGGPDLAWLFQPFGVNNRS